MILHDGASIRAGAHNAEAVNIRAAARGGDSWLSPIGRASSDVHKLLRRNMLRRRIHAGRHQRFSAGNVTESSAQFR